MLADPVLVFTKFTRRLVLAAHAAHQDAVQLAHKAQPDRVILQVLPRGIQRLPVVGYFLNILELLALLQQTSFLLQHLVHRGLRAFDLRGQHRFLCGQRRKHHRRVGNALQQPIVPSQGSIGLSHQREQPPKIQVAQG